MLGKGVRAVAGFGGWPVETGGLELSVTHARTESVPAFERAGQDDPRSTPVRGGEQRTLQRFLGRLEEQVGPAHFRRYFDRQTVIGVAGGHVDVTVPSGFLAEMLDRRFGKDLRRVAIEVGNAEVRFRIDRGAFAQTKDVAPAPVGIEQARAIRANVAGPTSAVRDRHRFEDFLVGDSNRLAEAACRRLIDQSERGGTEPVFVHGACGMGKTHLLRATAHAFALTAGPQAVKYTTAEAFTNEFIVAVRANKVDQFRRAYRRVKLLCLDDVHFLANKEATQTELLHTLDAANLDGARIVIASDEHPREIRRISERLVSRFMAGMVVRVDAPDAELRTRLVAHMAQRRGISLEPAAAKLVAERSARSVGSMGGFGGSVREIEGLVTQIDAVHRLLPDLSRAGGQVGLVLVRKAFGLQESDHTPVTVRPRRPIAIESVIAEVCSALCVELTELMGRGRHKRVVLARSLVAYLGRRLTTLSFPELARSMGRPNHSTVITAQKRLQSHLDVPLREQIDIVLPADIAGTSLGELAEILAQRIVRSVAVS